MVVLDVDRKSSWIHTKPTNEKNVRSQSVRSRFRYRTWNFWFSVCILYTWYYILTKTGCQGMERERAETRSIRHIESFHSETSDVCDIHHLSLNRSININRARRGQGWGYDPAVVTKRQKAQRVTLCPLSSVLFFFFFLLIPFRSGVT